MIEIFTDISDSTKKIAKTIWDLAILLTNPSDIASFLNVTTNYYKHKLTEEEINFLQIYFNTKMEELAK